MHGMLRSGSVLQVQARSKHPPAALKIATWSLWAPSQARFSALPGETWILPRLNLWEVHTSPTDYRWILW